MAYGFYIDSSICTGCKSCQVACKEYHHLATNQLWRRVYNYQGGSWTQNDKGSWIPQGVFGYFVSIGCNHCENPACVANCPTGAMQKDPETGIVINNKDVCIGCGTCTISCPYGAPVIDEAAGVSIKCDFCKDDLALGREPVCVATCAMRALKCGDIDELRAQYGTGNCEIEPLPENSTNPSIVLNPPATAQPTGKGTGMVVSLPEELSMPR